jgi:hypothetical protein
VLPNYERKNFIMPNKNKTDFAGSDNNHQSETKLHGGEQKNGRLSQIKNFNAANDMPPNQYVSEKEE